MSETIITLDCPDCGKTIKRGFEQIREDPPEIALKDVLQNSFYCCECELDWVLEFADFSKMDL